MNEPTGKSLRTQGIQRAPAGAFARGHVDDTERALISRRLLIDTIRHLEPFKESLTVIGAHGVFARVQDVIPEMVMPSTNDADLAVNPAFVAPQPVIITLMAEAGLEPANPDRPGIYGYKSEAGTNQVERTTIDLIVPEAYAGAGRRAARITGQKNAASKAEGIELALHDRSPMTISTLPGDPDPQSVEIMVAGPAALLVAKAYKVRDRIKQYNDRPHRLRQKDSVDMGLLMIASDPTKVAETMQRIGTEHPEVAELGAIAADTIVSEYLTDASGIVREDLLEGVSQIIGADATGRINTWLYEFDDASQMWRTPEQKASRAEARSPSIREDRMKRFPELRDMKLNPRGLTPDAARTEPGDADHQL